MFGPPGSGKGTQSALVVKNLNCVHLSVGDLVRKSIREKSPSGLRIAEYANRGDLVPDEFIVDLLLNELNAIKSRDASAKVILDGFPRSLGQWKILDRYNIEISKSIFFDIGLDVCLNRLLLRWTCLQCGHIMSLDTADNCSNKVCVLCKGKLGKRDDDCKEAIIRRFEVYTSLTAPLKQYSQQLGKLYIVNADRSLDEIYKDVLNLVK